jgi:hypothetical protein
LSADTEGRAEPLDPEPPEEELPEESFPQADRTSAIAASVATPARRVRELLDNGSISFVVSDSDGPTL